MVSLPGPTGPNILSLASQVIDVKRDFQAAGDGVTDDTVPIMKALAAASSYFNAGTIYFPPGVYITKTQTLNSRIHIRGAGIEASIIKLKSGTNGDLFTGAINGYGGGVMCNVGAANATGSMGGIYNWSIQDITLDGNKAGQSGGPSYCLRQYGFGFIIQNVRMRNGYSGGLLSDWNGGGSSGIDNMEAQLVNVKIHDCNGMGFEWAGPHDSQMINLLVYNSGSTNVHVGPNATALLFLNGHGFSPGQGVSACSFLIEGSYGQYLNCVSEGSDTCNTVILAGDIQWIAHIFGIVGNPALQQGGLQLGQQAGLTPFAGSVNQSAGLSTAVQVSGCLVDANFNLNNNFSINFANETNNVIRAICYNTSGVVVAGTPNIQTSFTLYMNGLTPDGTIGKGGGAYHAIKANKALTLGDRTQDRLNVNTNIGKLELPNGTIFVAYTDNYTTHSLETLGDTNGTVKFAGDSNATIARRAAGVLAFGGTIALNQGSAQVIATSGTVTMSNLGVCVLNPAGNVTGIKLVAGSFAGQMICIINKSAFSITFDIAANSFVADGASDVIATLTAAHYMWSNIDNLWFRCV